jgi:transposase, IS30 family
MAYKQLTADERFCIYQWRVAGWSYREIGRRLGRSHTTIAREVARNQPIPGAVYWHEHAQQLSNVRRHKSRHARRLSNPKLCRYVYDALMAHWSPQTIAGRLRRDHRNDASMRVSPETIYRWIYRDARQGGHLHSGLRFVRRQRRRQHRYGAGRRHIPGRVGIEQRPAAVDTRQRFGDWEGDSVIGKAGASAICTQVERKSRYLMAAKLTDRTAQSWNDAAATTLGPLPAALRRTLTVDNGSEFARFAELQTTMGLHVYFADPYSAWQRGANENTNGLLRRYLPKGTDFDEVSEQELANVVHWLNHRPRRCLNYRTPHEVFHQAIRGAVGM